jgi:ribose transport system ATP-binding protein
MFGLMGAGRSELARAIYGLDKISSGTVTINGEKLEEISPGILKEKGIAFITENRSEEGLLMPKPISDNIVLATLRKLTKDNSRTFIDNKKISNACNETIEQLNIRVFNPNVQTARQLSGGNQQKVVIGKWLLTIPGLFILDEPTRGVDVGAKFEIYNHINRLVTENDSGVLFISSEMEELMGVCDRILVMSSGCICGELKRSEFNQENMLRMAIEG